MDIPSSVAAQSALTRQNVALSVVKHNAQQDQKIAQIIDEAARSAPAQSARGTHLDIVV